MLLEVNKSLQNLHTFGIHVKTRYYHCAKNIAELKTIVSLPELKAIPKLIVGQGSNVLFLEDFEGLILQIALTTIEKTNEDEEYVWIRAGAGIEWHTFVKTCVEAGYGGIENLSLIPGTVGGAPIQNIGAYGVEVSDVFDSLEALEITTGVIKFFTKGDCDFGYRRSIFKESYKGQYIVLGVTFKLHKKPVLHINYDAIQAVLKNKEIEKLTIKDISEAIIHIRQQKLPDPAILGNAGSFFKNPIISQQQAIVLKEAYPSLSLHALPEQQFKLSAAWLIEQCGWKGYRKGGVGVSPDHALVLVHYGNGTGWAIYELAKSIQESVWQRFNIMLIPEVNIITRTGDQVDSILA